MMMTEILIYLVKKRHNHIDVMNYCLCSLAIAHSNWISFILIAVGFSIVSISLERSVKPSNVYLSAKGA